VKNNKTLYHIEFYILYITYVLYFDAQEISRASLTYMSVHYKYIYGVKKISDKPLGKCTSSHKHITGLAVLKL
jgi:hypothetical protein